MCGKQGTLKSRVVFVTLSAALGLLSQVLGLDKGRVYQHSAFVAFRAIWFDELYSAERVFVNQGVEYLYGNSHVFDDWL
jgi:hypothetical protein